MKQKQVKWETLAALCIVIIVLVQCNKKETAQSPADKIAGNYLVNDTLSSQFGCDGGPAGDVGFDSYGIVITKKDDNTVTVSSFNHCTVSFDASVTEASLVALATNPCASVTNVTGAISGNQIRFNYKFHTICEFNSRATAIKQP